MEALITFYYYKILILKTNLHKYKYYLWALCNYEKQNNDDLKNLISKIFKNGFKEHRHELETLLAYKTYYRNLSTKLTNIIDNIEYELNSTKQNILNDEILLTKAEHAGLQEYLIKYGDANATLFKDLNISLKNKRCF